MLITQEAADYLKGNWTKIEPIREENGVQLLRYFLRDGRIAYEYPQENGKVAVEVGEFRFEHKE